MLIGLVHDCRECRGGLCSWAGGAVAGMFFEDVVS